jgi:hypothetical protein
MCSIFSNSSHQTVERSMSITSTLPYCESTSIQQPHKSTSSRRHSTTILSDFSALSMRDMDLQRNEEKLHYVGFSIKDLGLQQSQQEMRKNSDTTTKTSSKHRCIIQPRLSFKLVPTTKSSQELSSFILSPEDDDYTYQTPEVQRQIRHVLLSSPPPMPVAPRGRASSRCCFVDDALLPESILMPVL